MSLTSKSRRGRPSGRPWANLKVRPYVAVLMLLSGCGGPVGDERVLVADAERALKTLLETNHVSGQLVWQKVIMPGPGQINVRSLVAGPRNGPPIILLHGAKGGNGIWVKTVGPLARTYRVYAPDLPGFGLSDKIVFGETPFLPAMSEFLAAYLDAIKVKRATVVGHSMGGLLALTFAQHHPERVSRLVLAAPLGFGPISGAFAMKALSVPGVASLAQATVLKSSLASERDWCAAHLPHASADDVRDFADYYYRTSLVPGAAEPMSALSRQYFTWGGFKTPLTEQGLAAIKAPTAVIWGLADDRVQSNQGQRARAMLPHARLIYLEHARHLLPLDHPEEFVKVLQAFLTGKLPAPPASLL